MQKDGSAQSVGGKHPQSAISTKTNVREDSLLRTSSGVSTVARKSSAVGTKILFCGDSVGHTTNLRLIEETLKCSIRSVKAYSSIHDERARWPEKNFAQVVKNNLRNFGYQKYQILVMSSPTVDITNLTPSKMN